MNILTELEIQQAIEIAEKEMGFKATPDELKKIFGDEVANAFIAKRAEINDEATTTDTLKGEDTNKTVDEVKSNNDSDAAQINGNDDTAGTQIEPAVKKSCQLTDITESDYVPQSSDEYEEMTAGNNSEKKAPLQHLENLPDEVLSKPNFFECGVEGDPKKPRVKWGDPANRKLYSDIVIRDKYQTTGFNIGDTGFMVLDFDHCFNEYGAFINDKTRMLVAEIQSTAAPYCETSMSGRGLHMIFKPKAAEFGKIHTSINLGDGVKLEIFYTPENRSIHFTGNVFGCDAKTPPAKNCAVIHRILKEVEGKKLYQQSQINSDNDSVQDLLNHIPCAELNYQDWVHVGMVLKSIGCTVETWINWSKDDTRYQEGECESKWQGFSDNGNWTIATLYYFAKQYGYVPTVQADKNVDGEKSKTTRSIFKNCPVNLHIPDKYSLSNSGIFYEYKENQFKRVSYTPLVISKKYYDKKAQVYKYQISYRQDTGQWKDCNCLFLAQELSDARKIVALADKGVSVIAGQTQLLAAFIDGLTHCNGNFSLIPTVNVYRQTGWVDDDFKDFIYPPIGNGYIVDRQGIPYDEIFKKRGDSEYWKITYLNVVDFGGSIARTVIGAVLTAPLCRPLNILNLQLHLDGKISAGKTPLVKFAVSIFGNPKVGRLIRTFAATKKNLLEYAMAFCDLPLGIDERETLTAKDEEKVLSEMVYDYSEGAGNQAQHRNGTSRPTEKFGGSRISTGEQPLFKINSKAGAHKRVLPLSVEEIFNEEFSIELHRISENNFGLYGQQWINYITENLSDIEIDYKKIFSEVKNYGVPFGTLRQKFNVNTTHLQHLTASLISTAHFEKMLGITKEIDNVKIYNDLREILSTLPTLEDLDDSGRAITFLKSYIAGHKKYLDCENPDGTFSVGYANDKIGKVFVDGSVAIYTYALMKILEGEGKFSSAEKLITDFARKGYLIQQDGNRARITEKHNDKSKRQWVYFFRAGILIGEVKLDDSENEIDCQF